MRPFYRIMVLTGVILGLLVTIQMMAKFMLFRGLNPRPLHGRDTRGATTVPEDDIFLLGAGKADITGPVVEISLNGYANQSQVGTGLRQRLYSRAFIVANPSNQSDSFIYVVMDIQSGDTAVRHGVLQGLDDLGGEYARYREHNLAVTGTHSHSGPGGWMNYLLPQIPSRGFDKQSYQAIVDGALLSIQRAHRSLTPGRLGFGTVDIPDGNINRSPFAYLANQEAERARYKSDTDITLTLLRFDRASDNKTMAILTFFSVHGTSLYENNTLVAGDNKGVAAWLFERSVKNDYRFADHLVAGFSQSSVGDTSPNVLGAFCEDTGLPCRFQDSTCNGKTELCRAHGPDFYENDSGAKSCFEIGRRQYVAAKTLYDRMDSSATKITGSTAVSAFHIYQNLSGYSFPSPFNSSMLTTCYAALGYSFAAGTTDGPGEFDFTQNASGPATDNPLWNMARTLIHQPSAEQRACQAPKDILLDVGAVTTPYAWAPNIVDIQVLRVGQLLIIVSASEASTMSARRWKEAIANASKEVLSIPDPLVLLGSPANSYAHYCVTNEEYSVQRYEGASTLYGPNTLAAYINLTLTYLPYLGSDTDVAALPPIPSGPSPPVNTNISLFFVAGVVYDSAPLGKSFGDTISAPPTDIVFGSGDIVNTSFVGANPRNNLRLEGTFAAVEWHNPTSGTWEVVRDDSDWTLLYHWGRTNVILGYSVVTLQWYIEDDYYNTGHPEPLRNGAYRMHYYGDAKDILGTITPFEGTGGTFTVAI